MDTGSTDGTPQLARDLGCTVFEVGDKFIFELPSGLVEKINTRFVVSGEELIVQVSDRLFDYSSARNFAAKMASNDVVSMPDADEQYTNLNIDAIEKVIDQGYQQFEFHFIFSRPPWSSRCGFPTV
jgi:glycosyltransferase involved in cell wall biosynthesis